MLGSEALKSTAQAGCWAACHDDAPGMASDSGQKLGKYLSRSRSKNTATGGGDSVRPQAELDAALAAGEFLELLEVDASGKGERVYVLDKLHERELAGHLDARRGRALDRRDAAPAGRRWQRAKSPSRQARSITSGWRSTIRATKGASTS